MPADATWTVGLNWQRQRMLIESLHSRGVMADVSLSSLLDRHADAGCQYGDTPAEFGAEWRSGAMGKVELTAAELDKQRMDQERFETVRDRVARRFGLLEPLVDYRRVTPEEMAEIRAELADAIPF